MKKTYQANHLDTSRIELILEFGEGTEFRRANRSKVCRVAKQNSPFAIQELVEVLHTVSLSVPPASL